MYRKTTIRHFPTPFIYAWNDGIAVIDFRGISYLMIDRVPEDVAEELAKHQHYL